MGGRLLAPHIDAERVTRFIGEQHSIDQFALLEYIVKVGAPADVDTGDDIERSWRTGTLAAPKNSRVRCGRSRRCPVGEGHCAPGEIGRDGVRPEE